MSTAGGRITAGVGANLLGQHAQDRNQAATVYVGNLDTQLSEELVWELFTQSGPLANVYLPKDRVTNNHQGYGFVEFKSEEDADYAIKVLNMIKVYGKPIRVNKSSQDKRTQDVGANLFIGNLDQDVDEKLLFDTFSAFGVVVMTPKLMRDPDTGASRGFGFVSYENFDSSDAAIEAMNGQFLCNRQITVGYAFKKDSKGERHGTPAERLLAEQKNAADLSTHRPNTLFATGPRQHPQAAPGTDAYVAYGAAASAVPPPPPPAVASGTSGNFSQPYSLPMASGPPAYSMAMPPPAPQYAYPPQGSMPPPAPWGAGAPPPPFYGGQPPPPQAPPRPPPSYAPPPGMPPPPPQFQPPPHRYGGQ